MQRSIMQRSHDPGKGYGIHHRDCDMCFIIICMCRYMYMSTYVCTYADYAWAYCLCSHVDV